MPDFEGYPYPPASGAPDGPAAFLDLAQAIANRDASVNAQFATLGESVDGRFFDVDSRLDLLEADTGWITPTLGGAWSVASGRTPQYRRKNGIVYIRGRVNGSGTTNIFTLPPGFQMAGYNGAVYLLDNGGTPVRVALDGATGAISPVSSGTYAALALDGIPPFPVG